MTKPLYYFMLCKIPKVYDPHFHVAAAVSLDLLTKKIKLILNPAMMRDFTAEDLKIVFEHETLHLAFNHVFSNNKFAPRLYNQAADYIINDNIPELVARYQELMSKTPSNRILANCCLAPKIAHLPELKGVDIRNMNSYTLAEILDKNKVEKQKSFDDHSSNGANEEGDNGTNGPNQSEEGSGDKEEQSVPSEKISQAAIDRIMAEAAKEALARPDGLGDLPSQVERHVKELTKSTTNYRQIMQNFTGSLKSAEYERTWTRRNRRYPNQVRGKRSVYEPIMVVIVDTSNSMNDEKVRRAIAGEIKTLSSVCKECWVIAGDTSETFRTKIVGGRLKMDMVFKGGGGTNLQFGFDFASKIMADGILCYTDGYIAKFNNGGIKSLFCIYPGGKDVDGYKNIKMSV